MRLAGSTSLAKDDALEPIVADDAAPQSIVEIEDETFLREPAHGGEKTGHQIAVDRGGLRRDFQLALKPAASVEPRVNSVSFAGARHIEKQHAVLRCSLAQTVVEPRDDARRRRRNKAVVAAEHWFSNVQKGLLNDRPGGDLASLLPKRSQLVGQSSDRLVDFS